MEAFEIFEGFIKEISTFSIRFDPSIPVQYNIFEEVEPETLTFNGYYSLFSYRQYLKESYSSFKMQLDRVKPSKEELENMLLLTEEAGRQYYYENVGGKRILLHDFLHFGDKSYLNQKSAIKRKVSGYLQAQKNTLIALKELLKHRLSQQGKDTYSDLVWNATETDLLELIAALWRCEIVTDREGKPASKTKLIEAFELFFSIQIAKPDVKLSKAVSRKIDVSPFLLRLRKAFLAYAEDRL